MSLVVAVLGIHVDDVIAAALEGHAGVLDDVHSKFEWGSPWVSRDFKFVGRHIIGRWHDHHRSRRLRG